MKTFLSIGSGPGIGTATAERFAQEGFRIVLTSRDGLKLASRAEQLRAKGHTVEVKIVDAGNLDSVSALVRETEAQFGAIDVLHFNAASMRAATLEAQEVETFVLDQTVNLGAALAAVKGASQAMLARGSGTILLTGGMFAIKPSPEYLSLSIGKAGLRAMTQALFDTFRKRGVHIASVNVAALVAPDSVEARGVADAFWRLYSAPLEAWSPEMTFPA
ncbi:SDR family oxidoreductase [Corallococcus carmarthensis]|uniref:SDR family NAD(P)-dependent oxidoreductase n=1 Tax=Corallococcus carmarthensis TaxID=2316728 RepID=A0A3A8K1H0_9BACT|nr:SDR family NAD(P)-dependent oxidoreductase [Corallococcus carmarthensis]RKG98314.1 SDR family NAD(P)-dependent oxidoreductase [Corallococcus carmarthensis]